MTPESSSKKLSEADFRSKIQEGQIAFLLTRRRQLPRYFAAGEASGFEVRILDVRKIVDEERKSSFVPKALRSLRSRIYGAITLGDDYVPVSIEKPETAKDYTPFWEKLKSLRQEKA